MGTETVLKFLLAGSACARLCRVRACVRAGASFSFTWPCVDGSMSLVCKPFIKILRDIFQEAQNLCCVGSGVTSREQLLAG